MNLLGRFLYTEEKIVESQVLNPSNHCGTQKNLLKNACA